MQGSWRAVYADATRHAHESCAQTTACAHCKRPLQHYSFESAMHTRHMGLPFGTDGVLREWHEAGDTEACRKRCFITFIVA